MNQNASASNQILINLKKAGFTDPFLTDAALEGVANFVYEVSSGYPSIITILCKEICLLISLENQYERAITRDSLKNIVIDKAFWNCAVLDSQGESRYMLSEVALGSKYDQYREILYDLCHNNSKNIGNISMGSKPFELKAILKELEDLQYIKLNGDAYDLRYSFLKYYLWHPFRDDEIRREVNELWESSMKV